MDTTDTGIPRSLLHKAIFIEKDTEIEMLKQKLEVLEKESLVRDSDTVKIWKKGKGGYNFIYATEGSKKDDEEKMNMYEAEEKNYIYFKTMTRDRMQNAAGIRERKSIKPAPASLDTISVSITQFANRLQVFEKTLVPLLHKLVENSAGNDNEELVSLLQQLVENTTAPKKPEVIVEAKKPRRGFWKRFWS